MLKRGIRIAAWAVACVLSAAAQGVVGAGSAGAASTCLVSPAASYSVTVCLDQPEAGALLSDPVDVVATVAVEPATAAQADRVVFSWLPDVGARVDLLIDHFADYRMRLVPSRLPTLGGALQVRAVMTDGFVASQRPAVPVTVSASAPAPPVAPQFTPRLGRGPVPGRRFTIAAVGDGVDGSPAAAGVANLIASWDPDVFAYLGDVYDDGTSYEFDTWYGDPTGYGRFRDITNPAIGNHEYMKDPAATAYFQFWGNVPHYYSYDVAGWHVVVLDSTTEFNQVTPGTPQYDWLAADLAAHPGQCTLSYLHHPRYSSVRTVSRPDLSQLWSLLVDGGVTLSIAGHSHTYERWTPMDHGGVPNPAGMTQFIAGTGGRPIENPKDPDPRVLADLTLPGALRVELGSQDATFTFAGSDGIVRDAGTVPCRSAAPAVPPAAPVTPTRSGAAPVPATVVPTSSSRTLLSQLRTAPERPAGFRLARFGGTVDADGDGCSTAADVLLQEAVRPPTVSGSCALTGGRWQSPYDGVRTGSARRLTVDHLVPLSEAWQSGAFRWRTGTLRRHANDLGYRSTLAAVSRAAEKAKNGREPLRWLPRPAYRCSYTAQWVAVKWRWRLTVDPAERRFLLRILRSCRWPSVRAPARAPVTT